MRKHAVSLLIVNALGMVGCMEDFLKPLPAPSAQELAAERAEQARVERESATSNILYSALHRHTNNFIFVFDMRDGTCTKMGYFPMNSHHGTVVALPVPSPTCAKPELKDHLVTLYGPDEAAEALPDAGAPTKDLR